MTDRITGFVDRLIRGVGSGIESVVFSPLPFIEGQLLVVCAEEAMFIPDLVAAAASCDPPKVAFHWLRGSELWQLALPLGVAAYTSDRTGGYPGFSYWLRHEGRVLWGRDLRPSIPLPPDPRRLLRAHLLASITWVRNHTILRYLERRCYTLLIEELGEHTRHLAATALLVRGLWRVQPDTVFTLLGSSFDDPSLRKLSSALATVFPVTSAAGVDQSTQEELEGRVYEAAWTYERLVACLRRYAG
jgi:hypothetical protein